jgi:hypothetical protein
MLGSTHKNAAKRIIGRRTMQRANRRHGGAKTEGARSRWVKGALAAIGVVVLLFSQADTGRSEAPLTVVVADFNYLDTSGEVIDQTAEHRARVASFTELLRENLSAAGYHVQALECPDPPCTTRRMGADALAAAARRSGARLVVYGGIRKQSTLVQWGRIEVFDLDSNQSLLNRLVSFRGDNDMAFSRAAAFVGDMVREAMPKP